MRSCESVARELGVTKSEVMMIERRAFQKIRFHCAIRGISMVDLLPVGGDRMSWPEGGPAGNEMRPMPPAQPT